MRIIKFRVWSRHNNKMYFPEEFSFWNDGSISVHGEQGISIEEPELMQFTGLLDKNGKEIYEGDILLWQNPEEEKGEGHRYKVIFDKAAFRTDWINPYGGVYQAVLADALTMEVIGNIYENPEPLKEKMNGL
jgi:uncharacterized phage protein (TIGR01671 family)